MILHLLGYTGSGASEMNFAMNHAPGVGLIARPVGHQSIEEHTGV